MVNKYSMPDDSRESEEAKESGCSFARLDTLKAYIREVTKYPILSREEEPEIARLVYEEHDLHASEKLAVSNLRLVVKIAVGYYGTYLNMLDLIQEGNVGLLHAVKKYNPYKGTKFSTYAAFWIRAYMLKYIMDSWSLVKVGTTQGQRKLFYQLNREKRRLESLGLYPAPKLLAANLNVKEEEVVEMEARLSCNDVYLEDPLREEGTDTILDILATGEDVEDVLIEKETSDVLAEKVKEFKTTLNEREVCILDHRLLAEKPKTLEQIGTEFNISRERVRQIERRIKEKAKTRFTKELVKLAIWPACNSRGAQNISMIADTR